eukprot:7238977-Pyramimonas_sp.AAC.1
MPNQQRPTSSMTPRSTARPCTSKSWETTLDEKNRTMKKYIIAAAWRRAPVQKNDFTRPNDS